MFRNIETILLPTVSLHCHRKKNSLHWKAQKGKQKSEISLMWKSIMENNYLILPHQHHKTS